VLPKESKAKQRRNASKASTSCAFDTEKKAKADKAQEELKADNI